VNEIDVPVEVRSRGALDAALTDQVERISGPQSAGRHRIDRLVEIDLSHAVERAPTHRLRAPSNSVAVRVSKNAGHASLLSLGENETARTFTSP